MLNQLMAVKRRREQGARLRIAKVLGQLQECEEKKARLLEEQAALRKAWRDHNATSRQVVEHEMRDVHKDFNAFVESDAKAVGQLAQIKASLAELEEQQVSLCKELAEARVGQEKLAYLLEQTP